MPDAGDVQPVTPAWPIRPANGDGKRKPAPPAKDKQPATEPEKDDDGLGHVDEYAAGE
jgi:hypothetical protein